MRPIDFIDDERNFDTGRTLSLLSWRLPAAVPLPFTSEK
jgi:hypothetical protein